MEILRSKMRGDLLAAWTYGKEAYQLLLRHRSLLLLPIALALFNAVESGVGTYVARTQTYFGKGMSSFPRTAEERPFGEALWIAWYQARSVSFQNGVGLLSSTRFRPDLKGTRTLLYAAAVRPSDYGPSGRSALLSILVWLLRLLLGAFVTAGYLGQMRRTLAGESSSFRTDGRAHMWPMAAYFIALLLLYLPSLVASFPLTSNSDVAIQLQAFGTNWTFWIAPILTLFAALTPMALAHGEPLSLALKRSRLLVWSNYLTMLALAVGAAILCLLPLTLYGAVRILIQQSRAPGQSYDVLWMIPVDATFNVALSVVAVWAVLALFVWYRDAQPAPAPEASEEAPPLVEG